MEHFQDDQLNSGRAHHQRAHQVISTPKPYSFDFPGVDGYRETSFHSQMHPVNYPTHLYPSVTGHFSIKEETDDSSDNRQQMGTKGVCLLSHSRVPPVGYNLNGEGHGMDGSIHHLQQDSLSSHGLPHHGYSSAVLHNSEHHEHSLNAYDGSNSSNFGLNSGLVSFMPGLPVEQNQHLSALAAVSSNRRFYDSQPIPSSSSLVPHFPNEYRNRDLEEERHGGSLKGPSVSCSPALDVLPPSCVQATCPSETGTPLSALNQLASVDDSRNHDPRRMFTNDPSSNVSLITFITLFVVNLAL
ncbi:unnamed protein product [Notodromas monacha]|uniref:Uncharacterized protein n=1 Tax=Notodromas monacha TaxID=399045 RepID=A0A7R9BDT1_9CRUS|nr:unnamed protein product [Notodromas monacha]CAG0912391.1 unnamed protein product [Notodromas monacha]